jgi:hypothetical protein
VVNEPMSPLDPRVLDALRAERAAPADARGRVRARLEAAVPEMRSSGAGGAGANGAAAGALGSRLTTAVALFVAGGVTGAALLSALAGTKPARVVYVDRPVPVAGAPAPLVLPSVAPVPAAIDGTPWSIARPAEDPAKARHASRAADPHESRLAAEQHLLDAARAAIVAGEPERAVTQLERHRAQFPDGLLVEERDAMMIEALAKSSHTAEARALAEAFRARYPGSLFAATVDSAVAPTP